MSSLGCEFESFGTPESVFRVMVARHLESKGPVLAGQRDRSEHRTVAGVPKLASLTWLWTRVQRALHLISTDRYAPASRQA